MGKGTIELVFLGLAFWGLQFWWIRMTIKNGRTGEVDEWGQRLISKKEDQIEINKKKLEKLFRS
tara:strand:- start:432 stop:623 length:192 start_codon:yes stop_codon:yes gene_type:complete